MQQRATPPRLDVGRRATTRVRGGAAQARLRQQPHARHALLLLSALLPGCVGSPAEGPFEFYRQITGEALEGRQLPPGLETRFPNLSAVPSRPERGPAGLRAELTAALAANRGAAVNPVATGVPVPDRPATEGAAVVPAAPPPPARIIPAPPVGSGPATLLIPGAQNAAGTPPAIPDAPPELPSPDLLAPPPPDLSAPPPPPRGL